MEENNKHRIGGSQKTKASPPNKRIFIVIFIMIIILSVAVSTSYFMWKWYNEMSFKGAAIATGRDGDIRLYIKFNKTIKLDETVVINFTLENSGNTVHRFVPLYAGGSFEITNRNGDVIYNSHVYSDYGVTNDSLVELHLGEKTYWEDSYLPNSVSVESGGKYFITGYYSHAVLLVSPFGMKYWEGYIITNKVMIRVV